MTNSKPVFANGGEGFQAEPDGDEAFEPSTGARARLRFEPHGENWWLTLDWRGVRGFRLDIGGHVPSAYSTGQPGERFLDVRLISSNMGRTRSMNDAQRTRLVRKAIEAATFIFGNRRHGKGGPFVTNYDEVLASGRPQLFFAMPSNGELLQLWKTGRLPE